MYVGEGSVIDIINWFRSNSSARWLGFFVGGSVKYDKFINDVLRKGLALDVISGSKIDLFLFGVGQRMNFRLGNSRDATISALPLTELHQQEDNDFERVFIKHISEVNRSAIESRKIVNASAVASTEVKEMLTLGTDEVPCLVLLRKFDDEKLVLRTRDQAEAEFIIEFLRALNVSLERFDRAQAMDIPTEGALRQAEETLPKIKIEEDALARNTARLRRTASELAIELAKADVIMDSQAITSCFENDEIGEFGQALVGLAERVDQARAALDGSMAKQLLARAEKARIACRNARRRIANFNKIMPSTDQLERYLGLHQSALDELEGVVAKFDRKITYRLGVEHVTNFFGMSVQILSKAKKLIKLASAVKSGGASLLS
jgi:hypothetical protein